jgi:hypothetical protein
MYRLYFNTANFVYGLLPSEHVITLFNYSLLILGINYVGALLFLTINDKSSFSHEVV